jgi:hypothetical protein
MASVPTMAPGQKEDGSEGELNLFFCFKDTPKYYQWGFAGNYARLSRVSLRTKSSYAIRRGLLT